MILVTGATGNNGAELVKLLQSAGQPVRAMARSGRLLHAAPGVEFAIADFDDRDSIRRALDRIDRAILVANSSERAEARQLAFVETARAAGLRHIVHLSQLHAARCSPARFPQYHAVVEEAIKEAGWEFTLLRPNLYMQALLGFRASIVSESCFFAPAGDAAARFAHDYKLAFSK